MTMRLCSVAMAGAATGETLMCVPSLVVHPIAFTGYGWAIQPKNSLAMLLSLVRQPLKRDSRWTGSERMLFKRLTPQAERFALRGSVDVTMSTSH